MIRAALRGSATSAAAASTRAREGKGPDVTVKGVTLTVDLALTQGIPDFVSTLRIVLSEMQVESHVLAEEILLKRPQPLLGLDVLNLSGELGERRLMSHEDFKVLSRQARAVIRTGECQPYCNIALVAGVTF